MYPSCKIVSNPWRLVALQSCRPGMIMAQLPSEAHAPTLENIKTLISGHVLLNGKKNSIEKIRKNVELFWLRRANPNDAVTVYHQQIFRSCVRERRDFHTGQTDGFDLIAGMFSHAAIASMRTANMASFFLHQTKIFVVVAIKPIFIGDTLSICWCPSMHQITIGNEYMNDIITSMHSHVEKKQPTSWTLVSQHFDMLTKKHFDLQDEKFQSKQQQQQQDEKDYIARLQYLMQQKEKEESHEWTLFLYNNVWSIKQNPQVLSTKEDKTDTPFDLEDVLIEDATNKTKQQLAVAKRVLAQSYQGVQRITISWDEVSNLDIDYAWIQNVIDSGCKTGSYRFEAAQTEWVFTHRNK